MFLRVKLSFLLLLFTFALHSQNVFQKTIGGAYHDFGYSTERTSDGGYILCGSKAYDSMQLNADIYLIKTDNLGDTLWTRTYGGSGYEAGEYAQQTFDGGYVAVGITSSFGMNNNDIYLVKTDTNGDTLWTKTYGGVGDELGQFVVQTADSGFAIAGHTDTYGVRGEFILIKTNKDGDTLWSRTYGGIKHDHGYCVKQTSDGGFIIVGHTLSFGSALGGFYTVKTDASGNVVWTRVYGGNGNSLCYSVSQTFDGGYIIGGYTDSFGTGGNDVFIVKTNGIGDTLWTRTYGSVGEETCNNVLQTADSGYVCTGYTTSSGGGGEDVYLVKMKKNGTVSWAKTYGGAGTDNGFYVNACADGGYMVVGTSNSFGNGDFDVYIVKTDSLGNSSCNDSSAVVSVFSPLAVAAITATTTFDASLNVSGTPSYVGSGSVVRDACLLSDIKMSASLNSVVEILPNPSNGIFSLKLENIPKGILQLIITNSLGDLVYSVSEENKNALFTKEVDLSDLSAGTYFVHVIMSDKVCSSKILIAK